MSGNRNSGNRSGRSTPQQRQATVAPHAPSERIAKLIRDEKPLTELPPKPRMQYIPIREGDGGQGNLADPKFDGVLNDEQAHARWRELGELLLDHGMLSELDLPALEIVVTQWRITEAVGAERPQTYPSNLTKVLQGLKALGLTKDGRVPENAIPGDASTFPPGHPLAELYNIGDARQRKNKVGG